MALTGDDFSDFLDDNSGAIKTNLNLTDVLLSALRAKKYIQSDTYQQLKSTYELKRNLEFLDILKAQPADYMTLEKTQVLIDLLGHRDHPRPSVKDIFEEWKNKLLGSTNEASPAQGSSQQVAGQNPQLQPPSGPKTAVTPMKIDRKAWCNFLDENREDLLTTLDLTPLVVEQLRVKNYLSMTQAEDFNKFDVAQKEGRAHCFLGMIRDKANKIEILIEVFNDPRYEQPTPAELLAEFLEAQRQ